MLPIDQSYQLIHHLGLIRGTLINNSFNLLFTEGSTNVCNVRDAKLQMTNKDPSRWTAKYTMAKADSNCTGRMQFAIVYDDRAGTAGSTAVATTDNTVSACRPTVLYNSIKRRRPLDCVVEYELNLPCNRNRWCTLMELRRHYPRSRSARTTA